MNSATACGWKTACRKTRWTPTGATCGCLRAGWKWRGPAREGLYEVSTADIEAYFAARHDESKATSSNRRLSVLKRFYQLALRQKHIAVDPCLKMVSAKQPRASCIP